MINNFKPFFSFSLKISAIVLTVLSFSYFSSTVKAAEFEDMIIGTASPSATLTSPSGDQKTAVILVNFADDQRELISTSSAQSIMFTGTNSINNYYKENSFNKVSFSGDIFGWVTIQDLESSGCIPEFWTVHAKQLVDPNNTILSAYARLVYIFPPISALCGFGGLAYMGSPSEALIFGTTNPGIIAHELGHNLGLDHANFRDCAGKSIDIYSNCIIREYYDSTSAMGFGSLRHFNAPEKVSLGWVPSTSVHTTTSDGQFTVYPLENSSSDYQVIRIAKPNTGEYYYISYRQRTGFDISLPEEAVNGVNIHTLDESQANPTTNILDVSPIVSYTDLDMSLHDGTSFYDPINLVTVTQVSHSSTSAVINVQLGTYNFVYGASTDKALAGDFNGDGKDTPAVVRDNLWLLRNSNSEGYADDGFYFANATDQQLLCDWDGNGTSTPGVFRDGAFYLKNSTSGPYADISFNFGTSGMKAICGDWDGDGTDTIGLISGNTWYLRNSNSTGYADVTFNYGLSTDQFVTGDWNHDGTDTPGVFRDGVFYLRNSNSGGYADSQINLGTTGDQAVAGDWDGNGYDSVGVMSGNHWSLKN